MNQADSTSTYYPFYVYDSLASNMPHIDSVTFSLDSVFAAIERPEVIEVPSIFTNHKLQLTNNQALTKADTLPHAWIFGILVGIILCTCLYFKKHTIHIVDILHSAIDLRAMDRILRTYNINRASSLSPIAFLWSATAAMAIYFITYKAMGYNALGKNIWLDIANYGILFVGCTLFYFIRNLLYRLISNTYEEPASAALSIISNYIFTLLETIVAVFLLLFVFYCKSLAIGALGIMTAIVLVLYTTRLLREFKIFLTQAKSSHLHLFYYLCIIEIGPIITLIYCLNIM